MAIKKIQFIPDELEEFKISDDEKLREYYGKEKQWIIEPMTDSQRRYLYVLLKNNGYSKEEVKDVLNNGEGTKGWASKLINLLAQPTISYDAGEIPF